MRLTCLGSSSKGNGYVLDNGKEALVLEAGVPFNQVIKAVGYDTARIAACLVSHEHGDHAAYASQYIKAYVPLWGSNAMREQNKRISTYPAGAMKIGGFTVMAFPVNHDVECYGFYIYHADMGFLVFATDTDYLTHKFSSVHHMLIEANYDRYILNQNYRDGRITLSQKNRVTLSHMSLETCIETIKAQPRYKSIKNVILLHMSDGNSDEEYFITKVKKETGRDVYAANKGLQVELSINPF